VPPKIIFLEMSHIIEARPASSQVRLAAATIRPRKGLMRPIRISRPWSEYRKILSENGVTAIEYALIASMIALVIMTSVALVGTRIDALFTRVANSL
jgi:pilus assembly protein Flp/PilA